MFGELGLDDVLKKIRRADEALTEFVAPLWSGVTRAAVWMEGRPQLFRFAAPPTEEGYFLCGTEDGVAVILAPASDDDARRYRGYLEKAAVILLSHGLAAPASFAERLQGITTPRPLHFVTGRPASRATARFDGVNLFYDGEATRKPDALTELFGASSIFSPGELLDVPGQERAGASADTLLSELEANPDLAITYRLQAVLESAGGILEDWSRTDDGYRVQWRRLEEEQTVMLTSPESPITSGICLPGARGFDPPALTRFLLEHLLDAWRP